MNWLLDQLTLAAKSDVLEGVVILKSYPWYSQREWNENTTLYEKEEIADHIIKLGFNQPETNKFLVMISGDTHMLTYDPGVLN